MSSESRTYRVEELISAGLLEIGDGYRAKNSELAETGIPFARAGNINNGFKFDDADFFPESELSRVGAKVSRPGDVVFTSKGTVGRFALVEQHSQRFVYSPQLCFWRSLDSGNVLPEYLYYWMSSQEFLHQVSYLKGQTDMADYVSLRDQRRMAVTIPSMQQQLHVVECLKPIDERITLLRETNATLEAIAQALFKSWFVDFDPVRAKAEDRQPEGMDTATAALFPDGFQESELGIVPKGWEVGSILDMANIISGGTPKTDRAEYWGGNIPWASAKDVSQASSSILTGTERTITSLGLQKSSTKMIPAYSSVVVARGATTGRMVMFGKAMAMNQTCYALESKGGVPIALYLILRKEIEALTQKAHGSVFDTITTSTFAASKILLIPNILLACFESAAAPLFQRILAGIQKAQTLTQLRDTLLPRLISGQLRLPEAEELVEEACA
ncbi:restriction endonuclease subunit S [Pseudomonas sp. CVAP|uniref:restriction endonuclease subunit S n=1 Tax=Pseudomonas sp. CVAP\|nr:restriction endonuclease subunit S [Pseudomonas sp. CVAP\